MTRVPSSNWGAPSLFYPFLVPLPSLLALPWSPRQSNEPHSLRAWMRTICVVFTLVLLGTFGAKEKHGKQSTEPPEQPFKASQWIPDIIRFVDEFDREGQPRNMEILDFFAGESNLCRRGRHRGFSCQTYDILHDKDQNILSYSVFFGIAFLLPGTSFWVSGLRDTVLTMAHRVISKYPSPRCQRSLWSLGEFVSVPS